MELFGKHINLKELGFIVGLIIVFILVVLAIQKIIVLIDPSMYRSVYAYVY